MHRRAFEIDLDGALVQDPRETWSSNDRRRPGRARGAYASQNDEWLLLDELEGSTEDRVRDGKIITPAFVHLAQSLLNAELAVVVGVCDPHGWGERPPVRLTGGRPSGDQKVRME